MLLMGVAVAPSNKDGNIPPLSSSRRCNLGANAICNEPEKLCGGCGLGEALLWVANGTFIV